MWGSRWCNKREHISKGPVAILWNILLVSLGKFSLKLYFHIREKLVVTQWVRAVIYSVLKGKSVMEKSERNTKDS